MYLINYYKKSIGFYDQFQRQYKEQTHLQIKNVERNVQIKVKFFLYCSLLLEDNRNFNWAEFTCLSVDNNYFALLLYRYKFQSVTYER